MRLAALVFAALFALPAAAGGMWQSGVRPGQVRCSDRPYPAATPVAASPGDNLQTRIGEACAAGPGIVELAPGTYSDANVILGTGGQAIGGECVVRAANPASKPVLRAGVGVPRAVFQVRNVPHAFRPEDLVLDGRRADQTAASMVAVCDDLDPADGVCDPLGAGNGQNTAGSFGIDSRTTLGGTATTCALRVDVIDTVGDGFFLRNQLDSAVEDFTATGNGCDSTSCPNLSVPADSVLSSILVNGRGVNWVESDRVLAVDGVVDDVTKQGIQCFRSTNCFAFDSAVSGAGSTGLTMLGSSGVMMGNAVSGVGLAWAQNSPTVNNGQGALVSDGGFGVDFEAALRGNSIANTWGDGIQVALAPGTPPAPIAAIERNAISAPCQGSSAPDNGGLVLGDSVDPYERILDVENEVSSSSCSAGKRVRNVPAYEARGTVISGSTAGDGVAYQASVISETDLTTDRDVEIDAASSGTLSGCALNGGAVVNDASSGAVARSGGC